MVTADELDLDEPGLPQPDDPAIRPDAIAFGTAPRPEPPPQAREPIFELMPAAFECIDDITGDARGRGMHHGTWTSPDVISEDLSVQRLPDVDGDGEHDWLVTHEPDCGVTGNCPRLLYLSRGCVSFAGAFWSAGQSVLPRTRGGIHDLETWVKGSCVGLEGSIQRLRWTGREYEVYETIECGCDETDPDRHPACPGLM